MSLMCGCDGDGYAEVFQERYRTARKPHVCSECEKKIKPGEEYHYLFTVFEGLASSKKTCMACDGIIESLGDLGLCFEEGELRQAYLQYLREYVPQCIRRDEKGKILRPRNHLTSGYVATYDPTPA